MDVLNKITFKNMAKYSLMSFIFGIFPLIALLLFYSPIESILGLLFSYIGLIGTQFMIYTLFFVKNKSFIVSDFISCKINSLNDEKISKNIKLLIQFLALLLSIAIVYIVFSVGSLLFSIMSLISVLNPLMIIALNIYYVVMALALEGNLF